MNSAFLWVAELYRYMVILLLFSHFQSISQTKNASQTYGLRGEIISAVPLSFLAQGWPRDVGRAAGIGYPARSRTHFPHRCLWGGFQPLAALLFPAPVRTLSDHRAIFLDGSIVSGFLRSVKPRADFCGNQINGDGWLSNAERYA